MWLKFAGTHWWVIALAVLLFALVQSFVLLPLVPLPWQVLWFDSLIHSVLLVLIGFPFIQVTVYGNLHSIAQPVRVMVYFLLVCFYVALSTAVLFWIEKYLFNPAYQTLLLHALPLRMFIALLLLCVTYLFKRKQLNVHYHETDDEIEDKSTPTDVLQPSPPTIEKISYLEHIAVKSGQKIHVLTLDEILYFLAEGDYVQVVTTRGKYLKEQTMKYFETHLPESQFIRVHRSCIVNATAISRIELYGKQAPIVVLNNGHPIKTSQNGYKNLRKTLNV